MQQLTACVPRQSRHRTGRLSSSSALVGFLVIMLTSCGSDLADVTAAFRATDGKVIRLFVAACNAELSASVQESFDEVVVRVTARDPYRDGDCGGAIDIQLSTPLDDRALIDASDNEPVEVRFDESLDQDGG
jgi:hypothetical protein